MDELIQQAAGKFGISEATSREAAGGLFGTIKEKLAPADFGELMSKIPGAEAVTAQAQESAGGGGGLLGGLMSKASSALGGGDAGDVLAKLTGSGLGADQAGGFVQLFVGFLKEKAGGALMEKVLVSVPGLDKLMS